MQPFISMQLIIIFHFHLPGTCLTFASLNIICAPPSSALVQYIVSWVTDFFFFCFFRYTFIHHFVRELVQCLFVSVRCDLHGTIDQILKERFHNLRSPVIAQPTAPPSSSCSSVRLTDLPCAVSTLYPVAVFIQTEQSIALPGSLAVANAVAEESCEISRTTEKDLM